MYVYTCTYAWMYVNTYTCLTELIYFAIKKRWGITCLSCTHPSNVAVWCVCPLQHCCISTFSLCHVREKRGNTCFHISRRIQKPELERWARDLLGAFGVPVRTQSWTGPPRAGEGGGEVIYVDIRHEPISGKTSLKRIPLYVWNKVRASKFLISEVPL